MTNCTTNGIASVVIQSVLIVPGLILYVVSLAGLVAAYKLTKNSFYLLMISLAIADIGYLCETLFYSVPCIILQTSIFGKVMERIVGHMDTTTWFLQCSHLLFISINRLRFVSGSNLQTFDKVFSSIKTGIWILIIWTFSLGMTGLSEVVLCYKYFDVKGFYWTFNCTDDKTQNPGMIINNVVSGLFCLLSGVLYLVTWLIVKCKRNSAVANQNNLPRSANHRISIELSLVIQFSAITAAAVLNYLGFWIIERILPVVAATMLIQVFAIANASISPYIYLLFNRILRDRIRYMFGCTMVNSTTDVRLFSVHIRIPHTNQFQDKLFHKTVRIETEQQFKRTTDFD